MQRLLNAHRNRSQTEPTKFPCYTWEPGSTRAQILKMLLKPWLPQASALNAPKMKNLLWKKLVFGGEYIWRGEYITEKKYYINYSPLNVDEYMQDGGRTTPNPPPLLSNEKPKFWKNSLCLQKNTVPLQLMEAIHEMLRTSEQIYSNIHFYTVSSCR